MMLEFCRGGKTVLTPLPLLPNFRRKEPAMLDKSKVCFKCKIEKESKFFFSEKKSKDGMSHYCKSCVKDYNTQRKRTKHGLILSMFEKQTFHSKTRGHGKQGYVLQEFMQWVYSQDNFNSLYEDWVNSNYQTYKRPSVDRIDDILGYSIQNIQLMTWGENREKQNNDLRNANGSTGKAICKSVLQYSKDNIFIKSHKSISIASRETNTNRTSIVSCLTGAYKTANNFIWKYSEEEE